MRTPSGPAAQPDTPRPHSLDARREEKTDRTAAETVRNLNQPVKVYTVYVTKITQDRFADSRRPKRRKEKQINNQLTRGEKWAKFHRTNDCVYTHKNSHRVQSKWKKQTTTTRKWNSIPGSFSFASHSLYSRKTQRKILARKLSLTAFHRQSYRQHRICESPRTTNKKEPSKNQRSNKPPWIDSSPSSPSSSFSDTAKRCRCPSPHPR